VLSYSELDRRAERFADRLAARGVVAGDRVAIMMDRSDAMLVAMLGVLKAGAAYVPLDATNPPDRLAFMIADTGARLCATQEWHSRAAMALDVHPVVVDEGDEAAPRARRADPRGGAAPAYVMYTSGSTGRPKGVVVPHRAIVRLVQAQSFARLDATRAILHLAPPTFDAATFEIWGALLNGGRCVLAPEGRFPDLPRLRGIIAANQVTTVWLTASLFNAIVDQAPDTLRGVDEILAGGEALSVEHVRRAQLLLPDAQLINGYGPTESTTFACCHRIPRPLPAGASSIPIGRAIANTTALILDAELREVAAGAPGDLYLGGAGLALEYLNLPQLTAERFLETGFGRLYRTGDRARTLPDGTIEFLGRDDDQVKLRGHRIELGEIEGTLRALPGVANAVVALREDVPGDKRLVAYFTLADCIAGPAPGTLRAALAERLPEYMIPSVFAQLDAIPLTENGKANRRALPRPGRARPALDRPALAPRSPVEHWIAGLWLEVLQLDDVGVNDRFFELGGTSITAMRFLARLNESARTPIPALVLFRAPTIAELAIILEREFRDALPVGLLTPGAFPPSMATMLAERSAQRQQEMNERRMRRRRA
jgi:amino acid adenylation domain-containing protein